MTAYYKFALPPLVQLIVAVVLFSLVHRQRCRKSHGSLSDFHERLETYIPTVHLHIVSIFLILFTGLGFLMRLPKSSSEPSAAWEFRILLISISLLLVPVCILISRCGIPGALRNASGSLTVTGIRRYIALLINLLFVKFACCAGIVNIISISSFSATIYFLYKWARLVRGSTQ
jgi:hypothetical protein